MKKRDLNIIEFALELLRANLDAAEEYNRKISEREIDKIEKRLRECMQQ